MPLVIYVLQIVVAAVNVYLCVVLGISLGGRIIDTAELLSNYQEVAIVDLISTCLVVVLTVATALFSSYLFIKPKRNMLTGEFEKKFMPALLSIMVSIVTMMFTNKLYFLIPLANIVLIALTMLLPISEKDRKFKWGQEEKKIYPLRLSSVPVFKRAGANPENIGIDSTETKL